LKPRLVMCLPISQLMSSPLLMARSSWKPSFSIRVLDQLLMLVCLCQESDQQPRLRLWSKWLDL
jgi:hypothetical protein